MAELFRGSLGKRPIFDEQKVAQWNHQDNRGLGKHVREFKKIQHGGHDQQIACKAENGYGHIAWNSTHMSLVTLKGPVTIQQVGL